MNDYEDDFNCRHDNDLMVCLECKQESKEQLESVSKRCGYATKSGKACQQYIALDAIACHIHA